MRIIDLLSVPGAALLPLADAIAKATILFATAGMLSVVALRRGSAAARHMIWTLALLSALVLPVLSIALPRWQVDLVTLPAAVSSSETATVRLKAGPTGSKADPTGSNEIAGSNDIGRVRLQADHPNANQIGSSNEIGRVRLQADQQSDRSNRESRAASLQLPLSWPAALLALWSIGAGAILGRLLVGLVAVEWMSRRTERVTDAPWLPQARALAAELGISPRIAFLRSGRAAMPMAWGLFRPAVLMPSDADHWPAERLRLVLLHELAHVKRHDCLTHILAQIACAAYWFNPLAWIAARHVRTERERACDDLVLAFGTRGSDYADQLIEIARVMRAGRFPAVLAGASLAMAHRSQLEGRLMAILDPSVPRSGVSRGRTAIATVVFAVAVMPLASLQPWTVAAADTGAAQAVATPAPASSQAAPAPTPVTKDSEPRLSSKPVAVPPAVTSPVVADIDQRTTQAVKAGLAPVIEQSIAQSIAEGLQTGIVEGVTAGIVEGVVGGIENGVQIATGQRMQRGRAAAAQAKPVDPRTIAALTAALKDSDKEVRETALHALVQLRDPGIFEPLVQALSDAAAEVREQAVHGLGQLRDRRAIEPLMGVLKDQSADVRQQAIFALGQFRDRTALPALTAALKDVDADVREQAVFAIGQLRDPASIDALIPLLHDAKGDVREQVVFALGQIRDRRAVEPLISALKDTDPDVRQQAAFGLGQLRDRAAVEALVIALKDSVADVREQVAFALGQIRDPRAIDALTAALKDTSADVRRQAAFALGQLARQ